MKKLAIVGTAPSSMHLAPYNNNDYETWILNGVYTQIDLSSTTNITRQFDIHDLELIKKSPNGYYNWLQNCPIPVYMQEVFSEIPNAVKYPLNQILTMFPRKYFTNSISYMIALAVYEGYSDISLYGVNMAHDTEYGEQRPSCEYMIGYCEGKGINFYIPKESELLKTTFLYGFEEEGQNELKSFYKTRLKELDTRITNIVQQEEKILIESGYLHVVKEKSYLLGCRDDTDYYLKQKI